MVATIDLMIHCCFTFAISVISHLLQPPVVHCGSTRQTASIISMNKEHLRTGDKASCRFRFIKNPEYIRPDTRMVFREGRTKAVGSITKIHPYTPGSTQQGAKQKSSYHHHHHHHHHGAGHGRGKGRRGRGRKSTSSSTVVASGGSSSSSGVNVSTPGPVGVGTTTNTGTTSSTVVTNKAAGSATALESAATSQ